jgi:polyisoprenoid-binding protein YceI
VTRAPRFGLKSFGLISRKARDSMMPSRRAPLLAAGLAAFLCVSSIALAADQPAAPPAPTTDLSAVPKGDYVMDLSHTNVIFKVNHLGFSTFIGRFNTASGALAFNSKRPEKSKLTVKLDPASVDTKVAKLDEHLKGADFFDVAKFPAVTFKSTKIEKLTDTTGKVTGDLTLHGVTKPVTLDVTFHGAGPHAMSKAMTLGFGAKTTIKRSDFGISTYVPMVGDEVMLIIESEFNQPAKKS